MARIKLLLCVLFLAVSLWAERIVTLGPAVTNQILLLGSGSDIVGKTSYCDKSAGKPGEVVVVGSLLSLSLESIIALKPTVIFASGLTPEPFKEKLRKLGVKVVSYEDPKSYQHLCDNFKSIGHELNRNATADSILAQCNIKYSEFQREGDTAASKRLFFQLGTNPLYSVVKGSLGDELISLIGGENVFTETRSGEVSREAVLKQDPEIILISRMEKMSELEQAKWFSYKSLTAARNQSIYIVDSYAVGSPTPVSFLETVEEFRSLIAPADYREN